MAYFRGPGIGFFKAAAFKARYFMGVLPYVLAEAGLPFGGRKRKKQYDEQDARIEADKAALAALIQSNAVMRRRQHFAGISMLLDL